MDCTEYIDKYLAAHADGELCPEETRMAEQHLDRCANRCRALLADEHLLKALIRKHARILQAPEGLKDRIRATLGQFSAAHAAPDAADGAGRSAGALLRKVTDRAARNGRAHALEPKRFWVPAAVAASLLVALAVAYRYLARPASQGSQVAIAAFDLAIGKYRAFETGFQPNVPEDAFTGVSGVFYAWMGDRSPALRAIDVLEDVSSSYQAAEMPFDVWNFEPFGYHLIGGRIDRLADGRRVTYTYYRSFSDAILCVRFKVASMSAPPGALFRLHGRAFYSYKGCSLCLTFYPKRGFVGILVSSAPLNQFVRSIALAGN